MKKCKIILLGLITLFMFQNKVLAAGSIGVNSGSVYVGNSVTVSVTVSQAAAWEVHIGVNGAISSSSCGDLNFADSSSNAQNTTKTYTTTCRTTKTGTINFTLSGNTTDANGNTTNLSGSRSVSVINKPTNNPGGGNTGQGGNTGTVTPKSSVNYLKSLEVEGKEINPKFDKETSEYTLELEAGTTSINIKADAAHDKASVTGTGKINLTEGINNLNIVVTAENGSKRTYKLKVNVKEKDPIIVKIDGKDYTIIRKREQLIPASAFYSESTVEINSEKIPAYFGEVTGYTLIGLKDSEGVINLYTYSESKKSYKLYREFNFSKIVFYPLEADKKIIPSNYSKFKTTINDIELTCYKMNENDEFMLLYGINIENNNEGFYIYDPFENTLQRYNDKIFDLANDKINFLTSIVVGLMGIIIIVLLAASVQGTSSKTKRKYKQDNNDNKNNKITKEEKLQKKYEKKEAKKLEKDLKQKEKEQNKKEPKVKNKKNKTFLDDTHIIDVNQINLKK